MADRYSTTQCRQISQCNFGNMVRALCGNMLKEVEKDHPDDINTRADFHRGFYWGIRATRTDMYESLKQILALFNLDVIDDESL